jgi:hypothetical protein
MTKLTWKKCGVAAVALSVGAFGLAAYLPSVDAAQNIPPAGTYNPCRGFKGHPVALAGGPTINSVTEGGIGVVVGSHFRTSDGRNGADLIIREVRSSGQVEGLGFVEIGMEGQVSKAAAASSTIVANQVGTDYPATQTMRFAPTVTIDGKAYRALDVANLTNSAVKATPPPIGTVYVLTNEIRLEDVNQPGRVAMTIKPGKAFTVTGHGDF